MRGGPIKKPENNENPLIYGELGKNNARTRLIYIYICLIHNTDCFRKWSPFSNQIKKMKHLLDNRMNVTNNI